MHIGTTLSKYSQENIQFQRGGSYFQDLVESIKKLRAMDYPFSVDEYTSIPTEGSSKKILETGIEQVIKDGTNLNVIFGVDKEEVPNAYVITPTPSTNNAMTIPERRSPKRSADQMKRRLKDIAGAYRGSVDLKTGRISGHFEREVSIIVVTKGLLMTDLSDEEVAAVVAHEIGHIINYFIFFGRSHTIAAVGHELTQIYNSSYTTEEKTEVLGVVANEIWIPGLDVRTMAAADSADIGVAIFVESAIRSPISIYDSAQYDKSSYEALADQYVSRLGAGRHLASAHRKVAFDYREKYHTMGIFARIIDATYRTFTLNMPLKAIVLLCAYDEEGKYDPPAARVQRLRRDLSTATKGAHSDEERMEIDDAVTSITKDLDVLGRDPSMSRVFHEVGGMSARSAESKMKLIQDLEKMAANELNFRVNRMKIIQNRR